MDLNSILINRLRWSGVEDVRAKIGFYPSSASVEYISDETGRKVVEGACLRQQYYAVCGVPETNHADLAGLLKMHFGNLIHDGLTELLSRSPQFLGAEKRMYRPYEGGRSPISGRVDLFMLDETTGLPIVGEVKTGGGYFFERYQINGTKSDPARPRESDVCQLLTYLDFYGQFGTEKGFLYYVDRASGSTKQYTCRMDDDGSVLVQSDQIAEYWRHISIGAIDSRWAKLQAHLEAGELPGRDYSLQYCNELILALYEEKSLNRKDTSTVKKAIEEDEVYDDVPLITKGDWRCGFCRYKDLCYGNEWDDSFTVEKIAQPFNLSPEQMRRIDRNDAINATQEDVVDVL